MVLDISVYKDEECLDFSAYSEESKNSFLKSLDKITGSKAIIWDPVLISRFSFVVKYKDLKDHGVTNIFELKRGACPASSVDNVVFVVRPKTELMAEIAENIRSVKSGDLRAFHLFMVPDKCILCQRKLRDAGVFSRLKSVLEIPVNFYQLADDVLSMEQFDAFRDLYIHDDKTSVWTLVGGILQLEALFGTIPNVYYKGDSAQIAANLLLKRRSEEESNVLPQTLVDSMVLFDRSVDLLSPLITQLTYHGLIDEIFEIKNNIVKLPADRFSTPSAEDAAAAAQAAEDERGAPLIKKSVSPDLKAILLSPSEDLFVELRDLNFQAVGPHLSRTIKSVSDQIEERHKATTIRDYRDFVKRLPKLTALRQSAATHTAIAELIKESTTSGSFLEVVLAEQELLNSIDSDKVVPFIEDSIARGEDMMKVMRLLCIQSLTTEGLKIKVYDQYKRDIVQSYGINALALLHNLEVCGMLRVQNPKNPAYSALKLGDTSFSALRKALRLIVDDVNEQDPQDLSYVWSGYAGILARLAQYWHKPGWRGIQDVIKRLPGAFDMLDTNHQQSFIKKVGSASLSSTQGLDDHKTVLFVFIGGVTCAEMSAIRFLAAKEELNYLIITTSIVTGNRLIQSLNTGAS